MAYHRHVYREDIAGPTWVYRLRGAAGELLYVGVAADPRARFVKHHRKPWWHLVNRVELTWKPTRTAAFAEEREAIIAELPIHNIARPKGAL